MSQEIEITGYTSIRKDRIDKKGGGVLVYIRKDINFIRKSELESDNVESIWLQLFLYNKNSILVGLAYRPPDAKCQWIKHFEQQIYEDKKINTNISLLGDFNFDLLKVNSHKTWNQESAYDII